MAHLNINVSKLKYNVIVLKHLLRLKGINMVPVTKALAGDQYLLNTLKEVGIDFVAEARPELLHPENHLKYMMIKAANPNTVNQVIQLSDISIQTEMSTILSLNELAIEQGQTHPILIMVDWKDGREGVLTYELCAMIQEVSQLKGIELKGLAFNFMCYRPLPPTEEDVHYINHFIQHIEEKTKHQLEIISGGNSSMLTLSMYYDLGRINELRVGEAWLRGYETSYNQRIPALYDDAFLLEGVVLEVKPRLNLQTQQPYMQVLIDIGQLDTDISGLTPLDRRLKIIGSTSDILMVNLGTADDYQVGHRVTFKMSYNAIAQSMHMSTISKSYHRDNGIERLLHYVEQINYQNFSKQY